MKWNFKYIFKKEKKLEDKAGKKIVDFEENVDTNKKYWWFLAILVTIGVLALFFILHFVSGVL